MVEKRQYETIKEFAKDYRTEIGPMMKSKGFTLSISTSKGSYWNDGRMNFQIKKIPGGDFLKIPHMGGVSSLVIRNTAVPS